MPRPLLNLRVLARIRPIPADAPVEPILRELSEGPASASVQFDHAWVTGRVFYSLPLNLIVLLEEEFGPAHFHPANWNVERELATDVGWNWDRAGFRDGLVLTYPYLYDPRPLQIPEDIRVQWGMTVGHAADVCRIGDARLSGFRAPARGYCGWLLSNPSFLAEHDDLLGRWEAELYHHWIPGPNPGRPPEPETTARERTTPPAGLAADFAAFYARWRLTHLAAPYLPCPAVPQVPAPLPGANGPDAGTTFYLPDTFPVPSREQLRDMLEDALRRADSPEHLAEWHNLVRSVNRSKGAIARYGRLFVLQHFWAVLHHRHGPALRGRRGHLERILARYLLPDQPAGDDTIHKDLGFIRGRLGPDWFAAADAQASGTGGPAADARQ